METMEKLTRKERTKILVQKLNSLSDDQKLELSCRIISSIEGRVYSGRNQMLIALQFENLIPTICGGFHQWKEHGRIVKKGEHGAVILYPVGVDKKKNEGEETEEPSNFFSAVVFDISQTEEINENE
ncbi:MAG: ArdC family protein [Melioribacteraceae bacterium]